MNQSQSGNELGAATQEFEGVLSRVGILERRVKLVSQSKEIRIAIPPLNYREALEVMSYEPHKLKFWF